MIPKIGNTLNTVNLLMIEGIKANNRKADNYLVY